LQFYFYFYFYFRGTENGRIGSWSNALFDQKYLFSISLFVKKSEFWGYFYTIEKILSCVGALQGSMCAFPVEGSAIPWLAGLALSSQTAESLLRTPWLAKLSRKMM
jgi:hypothetical protein